VVDVFGESLKIVSDYWAAREKLSASGTSLSEDDREKLEATVKAAEESLKKAGLTANQTVAYTLAPVEEWIKTNKPNPTEWAQDFAIPLELAAPPARNPVLTP
jgi:hypothetical protein